MKRFFFVIVAGLVLAAAPQRVDAQGTVSFAGAVVITNIAGSPVTGKISPASNYHFGLYFGATYGAALSSTAPVLVVTPNAGAFPGQISTAIWTIPGHPAGEVDFFVIKGWDGSAPTFEAAASGLGGARFFGASGVGQITTGLTGGVSPPYNLFTGAGGIGTNDLVLVEDPEPSTLALSSLALVAFVFHVRRTKSLS